MVTYLEAHGNEIQGQVFVPENLTLQYYAASGRTAKASVTLLIQALGDSNPARPADSVRGRTTQNNFFSELDPDELSYSLSIKDPSLDVRYVGQEPELPDGIMLCSRMGNGDCDEEQVRRRGRHTCHGLLAVLADAGEIHLMTCRSAGTKAKDQDYPAEFRELFSDLGRDVAAMVALTRTDPDEAWRRLNQLYGTPDQPAEEVRRHWATLDEAGRRQLIESQRKFILMLNENTGIKTFLDNHGDRRFLAEEGHLAFYAYYLGSDEATRTRIEAHFQAELDAAANQVAETRNWLELPGADWTALDAKSREYLLFIDGHHPDQPLRHLVAEDEVTAPPVTDWADIARRCARRLTEALPDEYAWFLGSDDRPERFLFETTPWQTIQGYVAKRAYHAHWATRAYEEIMDGDNVECGLTVVGVQGSAVSIRIMQETTRERAAVNAAIGHLDATGEVTVTLV